MSKPFALITGASSGIGLDLADILASNGYNLIITSRRKDILERTAAALSTRYKVGVECFPGDLADQKCVENLLAFIKNNNFPVNTLINNAGFGNYGPFNTTDWQTESDMINVNVHALVHLTKGLLPTLLSMDRAYIMNVASTAAFQPGPLMAVYYASKAFVLSFSEAIANELRDSNVTVTALCPGPTRTGFQKVAKLDSSRLMKLTGAAESYNVALFGYKQMLKGKTIAIPGFMNNVSAKLVSFFPRSLVTKIVRLIQEKSKTAVS